MLSGIALFVLVCSMRQENLFTIESAKETEIPGFRLTADYITAQEENELLVHLDAELWESDWRRRIQQYGLGYRSGQERKPGWTRDFPEWLTPLAEQVARDAGFDRFPENCVINEYIPP